MAAQENIYLITERESYFKDMGWLNFSDLYASLAEIDKYDTIQIDTETTGLSSFLNEEINSVQIGVDGVQYVFDVKSIPEWDKLLKPIIESKEIIGHYLAYDIPFLFKHNILPARIFDTQLAESVLTMGMEYRVGREKTLGACLKRYLNVDLDKSLQKTINLGLNSVEDILYAGRDVIYLKELKGEMLKTAARRQLEKRINFENRFLPVMCYFEYCGVYLDKDKLTNWIREIEADEVIAQRHLTKTYADINWGSSKQVGEILKEYGIEHYSEETGNKKTGDEILKKYDIPISTDLQVLRKASKLVSTYGRKWYHYILSDGRIHTKYKQLVDTGRTSSGEVDRKKFDPADLDYKCEKPFPNLQNVPRRKDFRACFTPKGANVFVICDYSSQESVILADQSGDKNLLKFFQEDGGDMHSYVTRLVYPELKDLSDEEIQTNHPEKRQICKTASFAIAYGGNGATIAANVNCSVEVGDMVYKAYMSAFNGLPKFFDDCYEFAWRKGYMPTDGLTGGKRFFDRATEYREVKERQKGADRKYWERYWAEKDENTEWFQKEKEKRKWFHAMTSSLRKESVNTRIQGTAAVMSKLACIYFYEWVLKNKLWGKVKMVGFIHDELQIESSKASAPKVSIALQEAMERAGNQCLKTLSIKAIPYTADCWRKEEK